MQDQIIKNFELGQKKGKRGKQTADELQKEHKDVETQIKKLQDEMEDALLADHESNKKKQPAFKRLLMLSKIESTLRKTNLWQDEFLHKDGC